MKEEQEELKSAGREGLRLFTSVGNSRIEGEQGRSENGDHFWRNTGDAENKDIDAFGNSGKKRKGK